MNGALAAGIALTTVGVAGYLVGLGVAYPGRAFSVTSVMVGITLVAVGRSGGSESVDERSGSGHGDSNHAGSGRDGSNRGDDDRGGGEPT